MFKDYYLILGIGRDATLEEIEKHSKIRMPNLMATYPLLNFKKRKKLSLYCHIKRRKSCMTRNLMPTTNLMILPIMKLKMKD